MRLLDGKEIYKRCSEQDYISKEQPKQVKKRYDDDTVYKQ